MQYNYMKNNVFHTHIKLAYCAQYKKRKNRKFSMIFKTSQNLHNVASIWRTLFSLVRINSSAAIVGHQK